MAQKIEVLLLDDLDGSEASQTVRFGLDGASYEIDLSDHNANALRDALADYVAHGRKNGRRTGPATMRPATMRPATMRPATMRPAASVARGAGASRVDREQTHAIREWARNNGHTISDRGRIPAAVVEAFQSAK
jgi:hypothetical protein